MTHAEAAAHLRVEVTNTANREVRPLLTLADGQPGYFNVVRAVLSDTDYLGALYSGWPEAPNVRQVATTAKAVRFIEEVYAAATANADYAAHGKLLYNVFRMGTVHLREPKTFDNPISSTPFLSWVLMDGQTGQLEPAFGGDAIQHLKLKPAIVNPDETLLPVSVRQLFEDFLLAVGHYAAALDHERGAGGATPLLDRWKESADAIVAKESTDLTW